MGMRLGKIAGTLQELSGEELARQQGLSAAPPTPLGAQGIGASQDVAKMAGTPNQIRAMVQDSLMERTRTKDLLGESERTGARARYSVESLQQKMNVLEGLGSLEGRVPAAVRTALEKATTVSVSNTVDTAAIKAHLESLGVKADEAAVKNAVEAVEKIRKAGATPAEVSVALQALKLDATITDGTTTLAGKLAPFFKDADINDIKKQMATALEDFSDIKMKELPEAEFQQYANPSNGVIDAAQILGLEDGEFGEMTLGEVRAQLKAWKTRNFQDVEILRDVLQDPSYSMAEKDFARQRLAEMGAVGVTSFEQKTNNIEAQVAEGDTVVVGGQAVKVSELMSDPALKATIATALESDEELAKLGKTDAQLADWITRNKAALVPAQKELLKGTEAFVANNKEFVNNLSDVMDKHKTFLESVIPNINAAKDVAWKDWLGTPEVVAAGGAAAVPATGLYATAPTVAYTLAMTDKTKRSMAMAVLSKLPTEQAKKYSTTELQEIVNVATDEADAMSLLDAYTDTKNGDWQSGIKELVTKGEFKFGEGFTEADYDSKVNEILAKHAPSVTEPGKSAYASVDAIVQEIKKLRTGGPRERREAIRLSGILANINGDIKTQLDPAKVNQLVEETKKKADKAISELAEFDKKLADKNTNIQDINNKIKQAKARSSVTPKRVGEIRALVPEFSNKLKSFANSFKGDFGWIGTFLRNAADGVGNYGLFTLDQIILRTAQYIQDAGGASKKHYSSASWASGMLFKYRDEIEAQGRMDAIRLEADLKMAQPEYNTLMSERDRVLKEAPPSVRKAEEDKKAREAAAKAEAEARMAAEREKWKKSTMKFFRR